MIRRMTNNIYFRNYLSLKNNKIKKKMYKERKSLSFGTFLNYLYQTMTLDLISHISPILRVFILILVSLKFVDLTHLRFI